MGNAKKQYPGGKGPRQERTANLPNLGMNRGYTADSGLLEHTLIWTLFFAAGATSEARQLKR
jgi:hypothetical protein